MLTTFTEAEPWEAIPCLETEAVEWPLKLCMGYACLLVASVARSNASDKAPTPGQQESS